MWEAIAYVSSGVTLAAFIFALAAWIYRAKILEKERLIRSAPDSARSELIEHTLEFFSVDTSGLTRRQKYDLALHQIHARAARFRTTAIAIIIIALLAASVSAFAIWQSPLQQKANGVENPSHQNSTESVTSNQNPPTASQANNASENQNTTANLPQQQTPSSSPSPKKTSINSPSSKKTSVNQSSNQDVEAKKPSDADFSKLMDTLGFLVHLEAGQSPIVLHLYTHCGSRAEPTSHLRAQASIILEQVRDIQRAMSSNYPDAFVLQRFNTYRQLVLDLQTRKTILEAILANKKGQLSPGIFCQLAGTYGALHRRLSTFQEDYRQYLLQQRGSQ
jgi:hypothetical protein